MIPKFDDIGNLPPGIWTAAIAEVQARYSTNQRRNLLFESLLEVLELLQTAKCAEIYLNGSFISASEEPQDYDLCYEWRSMQPTNQFREFLTASADERKKKYNGDIFPRLPRPPYINDYVEFWQTDRDDNPKGIIRIEL